MPLSWNEIKDRALKFSKEWENETSEDAEAKSFWDDFFQVFGLSRRRVATFEEKITKGERQSGYIDLLWKGQLLVEHKSASKDLNMAFQQAKDYFPGLKEYELPKYICVCNFQKFRLIDLDEKTEVEFELKDLVNNIQHFGFIAGYKKRTYKDQDPINIDAAYRMGKLHDELKNIGYTGHVLEVYLVRILFCLFAEDTTIFEKDIFRYLIENKTKEDGSDLGSNLAQLFQVLNTPKSQRLKTLDEDFNAFPYINGKLFEEFLPIASFNAKMRNIILECTALDWSKISPAIFGSLFQSVMNPEERRNLGAHYTSEKNIMKVIKPLFLDDLHNEFEIAKDNKNQLREFHKKLSLLKFLDPACGCGNFLVISYRELRLLELKILNELQEGTQLSANIDDLVWINLDQFYGIEIEEWPARISEVAMWLIDHQMNMLLSAELGQYFIRLPLTKSAKIVNANALRINWNDIVPKDELSFILGNPPFYGYYLLSKEQQEDMELIFEGIKGAGMLDYVTSWYIKASRFIQGTNVKVAFVSTNSISQGEQVGILWNELFKYGIKIQFAHRTFRWDNEAKGMAAVHVVIIGFANFNSNRKLLFEYSDIKDDAHEKVVTNINPLLIEAKDFIIQNRSYPINDVPKMLLGNVPRDGGYFIFNDIEKEKFIENEPNSSKYIKRLIGSSDFINNKKRWCLWLKDILPNELNNMPLVKERIDKVSRFRKDSTRNETIRMAEYPTLFTEDRQPDTNYILIPRHSTQKRIYIPFGYFNKDTIVHDSCLFIPNADIYFFGIISSIMHMAWVRVVCGRIKSDYRYSNTIVYNNFPWPLEPGEKNIEKVKELAQNVLDVRERYPDSSLADLYDPLAMPPDLLKAHKELDRAVDLCYRPQPFLSEASRLEFLFDLYQQYTAGLFKEEKKKRKKGI